jgi:hypothetical protein
MQVESEKPMKREQRSQETDARWDEVAVARGQLKRSQANTAALAILSKLEASLSEHAIALKTMIARSSRLHESTRRYIEREGKCYEGDLTPMANNLIAGGASETHLREIVSAARTPLEKDLYASVARGLPEPEDLHTIKDLDFERACCALTKRAIELQRVILVTTRKAGVIELSRSLRDTRAVFARKLLAAIKELNELADRDRGLGNQVEASEIQYLKPRPFPAHMLSGETSAWLRECVSEGLIEASEVTGIGLA